MGEARRANALADFRLRQSHCHNCALEFPTRNSNTEAFCVADA